MLDYENQKCPLPERRDQIRKWRAYAMEDTEEDEALINSAKLIGQTGINKMDSLHIASAIKGNADYFLTTDDVISKRASLIPTIKITDPIGFIKEVCL